MNINQIKELGHKAPITSPVVAEVREAYEQKSYDGQYGKKLKQRVKLAQGNDWIFCEMENQQDLSPFKGQTITITHGSDRDGKPTGVYGHKTEWQGKTYDNMRVTKSAKITSGGSAPAEAPRSAPTQTSQPTPQSHPSTPTNQPDLGKARAGLNQIANLMLLCYDAATYIRNEAQKKHGIDISPEAFEQKVSGLFIEANRKGIGNLVPSGTLGSPNPQTVKQEPAPEDEDEYEDDGDIPY